MSNFTWEDRKGRGFIGSTILHEKPVFSFEYAWILFNDNTQQWVPSHDEGVYNEDMTEEMIQEVSDFVANYVEPEVIEVVQSLEDYKIGALTHVKFIYDELFNEKGSFDSVHAGIEIDARRRDIQNITSLINFTSRNSVLEVEYKGVSELVTISSDLLPSILAEMEDYGIGLYAKKFKLESDINLATSVDEIKGLI